MTDVVYFTSAKIPSVGETHSKSTEHSTYQKCVDDLLAHPGVTGVDIENLSGRQCIVVYVEEMEEKPKLPKQLDKWPVVVVEDKAHFV